MKTPILFLIIFISIQSFAEELVLTPDNILFDIEKNGAQSLVRSIWDNQTSLTYILKNIKSGDIEWLEVAAALQKGSDAGSSEDLEHAKSIAFTNRPYNVILFAKKTSSIKTYDVCHFSWDSEVPDGMTAFLTKIEESLKSQASPETSVDKKQCLKGISDSKLKFNREAIGDQSCQNICKSFNESYVYTGLDNESPCECFSPNGNRKITLKTGK